MTKNRMKERFGLNLSEPLPVPYGPSGRYVTPSWTVWVDGKLRGTAVRSYRTGRWHWRGAGAKSGMETPARNRDDLRRCVAVDCGVHVSRVWLSRS